jgi:hypothetical protein
MKTYAARLNYALIQQLDQIFASGTPAEQYRSSITVCRKAMTKLKNYVASYSFENEAEEIYFFKEAKPLFYSRYIYYINAYNYYMKRPPGGREALNAYIQEHFSQIKNYFSQNLAFYQYYRSGATHLDQQYFLRGKFGIDAEIDDFEGDERYAASHDYKLSKIIANEKFQEHLGLELAKLSGEGTETNLVHLPFHRPNWTASQTDAIELIYALKASGAINNGNIDISELVSLWEFTFQIELKEYYHKYTDITRRKKDYTLFLSKLREGLLRWINGKLGL